MLCVGLEITGDDPDAFFLPDRHVGKTAGQLNPPPHLNNNSNSNKNDTQNISKIDYKTTLSVNVSSSR